MKVLVTGGAGFIGSHIVEKLQKNNIEVMVLDNLSSGKKEHLPIGTVLAEVDIRNSMLIPWMAQEKFDAVIHEAAQVSVPYSIENPIEDGDINLMGLLNLMEGARRSGVKRVITASSAAIYGDVTDFPIKEDASKTPLSFYGLSKLTAERYLELYQKNFGIEYLVLRYANVYGERQGASGEGGVIDIFCRALLENKPLNIFGNGEQTRDFIHVSDVAEANYQALLTSNPNQAYNIGSNREISLNHLVKELGQALQSTPKVDYKASRDGDILRSLLDSSAANAQLNWAAKTSLSQGLAQLFSYLKK